MIDEPKRRGFYGGSVAAPVFNKIVRRLVHLPDGPVESVPESDDGLPLHMASIEPNTGSDRESEVSDWAVPGFRGRTPSDLLPLDGRWQIERPGTLTESERARVAVQVRMAGLTPARVRSNVWERRLQDSAPELVRARQWARRSFG